EHVWAVLDAAFREFGLPKAMRSDNGAPFASTGAGGLSALSVRLIKAGVMPERIAPASPQQNGRLERLHLTLKPDTASPPAAARRPRCELFGGSPHERRGPRTDGELCYPSCRIDLLPIIPVAHRAASVGGPPLVLADAEWAAARRAGQSTAGWCWISRSA